MTIKDLDEVIIDEAEPDKKVLVRVLLSEKQKSNCDVEEEQIWFSWSHKGITGANLSEAKHSLNIDPSFPPVK